METQRLRLRSHTAADFSACARMWGDPEITRYIGGTPSTPAQSWSRILIYGGLWLQLGYGYWAVEEKSTGEFVGEIGFADFKRELTPSIEGRPELGWALVSSAHGRGYATEATRAALAWLDANLKGLSSVCLIHPENKASIRVAQKIGFFESTRTIFKGEPTLLFERPAR
ncbi:MAG TPA: GNAT family N-acetyltransferase [Bdellovibrionales bacterium]|nr:GNAT family N-acetyltransferase [Bdellovibrionales bacterium]